MWKRMILWLFAALALSTCGSKEKIYRIGIDTSWYPLQLDRKGPYIQAFMEDLLLAIAHEEGRCFEKIRVSQENLLFGLKERHYDGILTSFTPRAHTNDVYDFSELFLHTGPVLILLDDNGENLTNKMEGKRVAVTSLQDETLLLALYPKAISCYYNSISESLEALALNTIDAIIIDYFLALHYVQDLYHNRTKIVSLHLQNSGLRLLTLHGENKEFIKIINQGLKKTHDNGVYDRLLKKWRLQ